MVNFIPQLKQDMFVGGDVPNVETAISGSYTKSDVQFDDTFEVARIEIKNGRANKVYLKRIIETEE